MFWIKYRHGQIFLYYSLLNNVVQVDCEISKNLVKSLSHKIPYEMWDTLKHIENFLRKPKRFLKSRKSPNTVEVYADGILHVRLK